MYERVPAKKEKKKMKLSNGVLTVDFCRDCYAGQRFDNTGTIREITMTKEGRTAQFCTQESLIPGQGTGGVGLANEFGIGGAVGFEEAKPGGAFLKIGVGWLQKPDEESYRFGREYLVLEEGRRAAVQAGSRLVISWECRPQDGYACAYEKTIELDGPQLKLSYELKNTGRKEFSTTEYVHNFVNLDGAPYSEDYMLTVSDEELCRKYQGQFVNPAHFASYMAMTEEESRRLRGWKLSHRVTGVTMEETVDFAPEKFAVWAMEHVVSCELFIDVGLKPGECRAWSRTYTFSV